MGMLKQYRSGAWESRARGGGSGGGSGTSFDTNFHATLSVDQAVATGAARKILFDTVAFDGNSEWVAGSLHWLCKTSGYYGVTISASPITTYTNYFRTLLYIDGASAIIGQNITGVTATTTSSLISVPNLYVAAGSYLEAYCTIDVNTSVQANARSTFFRIIRYK